MERMRQEATLSMGWCIECHRDQSAGPIAGLGPAAGAEPDFDHVSTNCVTCHF